MIKTYAVKDLKPDMVTQEDVKTKGGQLIVPKGTALTSRLISRMAFYNIPSAVVLVPDTEEVPESKAAAEPAPEAPEVKQSVPLAAYSQKVMQSKEFQRFQIDYSKTIASIHSVFDAYLLQGQNLDLDTILTETNELYHSCRTTLELFDMLHNMRSMEDSVYAHSLNVALIARRIGHWLKFDRETQDTLTLAGLLHDIGKLKIPPEILNKPGKFTDEEFALVKQHPKLGYDLLKSLPLDTRIKKAALSHHERCDGSGYPMGLTQDDTDDFAMIIAIADVYDAMTAARSYRAPLCPFQVIDNFEREGLSKYKPAYILTFLSHVASTYQNNRVMLSDGRTANIVMLNDKHLSKPIVQLLNGTCIDLSTEESLHIQALL